METKESYIKSNLEKSASSIVVESLIIPPEHTQFYSLRSIDNSETFKWIQAFVFPWSSIALILIKAGIA
jgi:hypothetical protein